MSRLELIDAVFQDHARVCLLCGSSGGAVCKKGLAILGEYQQALVDEVLEMNERKAA